MIDTNNAALLGTWTSDPDDPTRKNRDRSVTLIFNSDGTLIYIAHKSDRDQVMRLTYRSKSGVIVTDQPSQPKQERTKYKIEQDGTLLLEFGGRKTRYKKK